MKNVDDLYNAIAKRYLNTTTVYPEKSKDPIDIYIDLVQEDKIPYYPYIHIIIVPQLGKYIFRRSFKRKIIFDQQYIIYDADINNITKPKMEYLLWITDKLCLFSVLTDTKMIR